jgi:outer membrane protein assembly factor BamA
MSLMTRFFPAVFAAAALLAGAARAESPDLVRIGRVYVVGNTRTRQNVILDCVRLYPGWPLNADELCKAEANLARLGLFKCTPNGSVRPTVTVLDGDKDEQFKDVLVTVEEDATGSLEVGLGWDTEDGLVLGLALDERNFDFSRLPTSWDDLRGGDAFRGGGQHVRLTVGLGMAGGLRLGAAVDTPHLAPWSRRSFGCRFLTADDCARVCSLLTGSRR